MDEGGRPSGADERMVEVDRPGEGAVERGTLAGKQLAEDRLMDERVAKDVTLLVDEQEVMLPGRTQTGIEHVRRQLDCRGE